MSSTRNPARPRPGHVDRLARPDSPSLVDKAPVSRFEQRRRAGRRRRGLKAALVALAVVALVGAVGAAVWAVYFSTMFAVTRVVVVGTHRLSAAQVEQAAHVPMGRPLMRLDTGPIRRNVAGIVQLSSVVVTTQWPHTVQITVVERTPAAVIALAGGGYDLVDREGVVLGTVTGQPPALALLAMDPASTPPAALQAAASVAASLTPRLAAKVRSITALTANSVELNMTNGSTVRWGDATEGAIKAEVLAALMRHPARVYDVSAPYAPITARG